MKKQQEQQSLRTDIETQQKKSLPRDNMFSCTIR